MLDHFKELTEWLRHREDAYHYELNSGEMAFDIDALEYEVQKFALEFEARLN